MKVSTKLHLLDALARQHGPLPNKVVTCFDFELWFEDGIRPKLPDNVPPVQIGLLMNRHLVSCEPCRDFAATTEPARDGEECAPDR